MIRHLAFYLLVSCLFPSQVRAGHQAPPELSGLLMDAVKMGDEKSVESLLGQGARANTRKEPWDATALEAALGRDNWLEYKFNKRIVDQLIAGGDAPESIFPGDYLALSEAVQRGDRYLLKRIVGGKRQDDNRYNDNAQLDTWRVLTIATLKEDVPMLKAIGECLGSEAVWGVQSFAAVHPFEIAIRFGKRKAFNQFLAPPSPFWRDAGRT